MTAASLPKAWYQRRGDAVSWAVTIGHLVLVLGAVYGAAVVGPSPRLVVLWLWFGLALTSLLNLMHECAHYLAFRRRASSDLLGRWILGPLVLADFDRYRERHWAHHRKLGADGDTKDAYLVEIGGAGLVRLLASCLCLREAVRKLAHQSLAPTGDEAPAATGAALLRTVVVQVVLLGSAVAVAAATHDGLGTALVSAALAYIFVYAYGLSAVTVFAATLRAVAEHQRGDEGGLNQGRAALRNFTRGRPSRLVFGSYGFADHATHHLEPGIPHYRLPAVTAALAGEEPALQPGSGYLGTLWALASRRSPAPAPAPAEPTAAAARR